MIFKDQSGTRFTWRVACIAKTVDEELVDCIQCYGKGVVEDLDGFCPVKCYYCSGTGKKEKTVLCFDQGLEKFLESKIEEYYEEQKNNFIGENI